MATTEFIPALGTAIATGVRFTASSVCPKLGQIEAERHIVKTGINPAIKADRGSLRRTQRPGNFPGVVAVTDSLPPAKDQAPAGICPAQRGFLPHPPGHGGGHQARTGFRALRGPALSRDRRPNHGRCRRRLGRAVLATHPSKGLVYSFSLLFNQTGYGFTEEML
ncbi:hypothetical protein MAPG_06192 [Magnaporthiopsis poae ATCC 64411]|uniref:Uncharacterized protein n=1 Tax=Magnaporthiopsis poae (strain ATCC 64411 / 73-15) TaxID=644358 RepID=A0A0C4E1D4_MAGP6|nr:hypothetical protein MAPG_06192 [Magnaporthiopsis poae ATCC 64411]